MLSSYRRFCVPAILIFVFGPPIGCNLQPLPNGPGDQGTSDPGGGNDPDSGGPVQPSDDAMPDFFLADVNESSSYYQEPVSPRDYLGRISAWYFGRST
ncbi:MAG: hypothetical protein Q7R41_15505 [Phycisphaerales bacterium]|nr:hypothetical protein [Phycisphaerales bacterium]